MTETNSENPRHEHDCNQCVFLGHYGANDLYFHPSERPIFRTVIARFGSGGDYMSGLAFAGPYTDIAGEHHKGNPPLVEAKRRAVERGFLKDAP